MAVFFDQSVVNQVQQANDIVDVISEHVNLVKKGREMVGLCPFHEDPRPSMNVNGVKQIFKCFACGAGGDVFKFVQMREGLSFSQAIERLAERAGIKLKPRAQDTRRQRQDSEVDPNSLARVEGGGAFAVNSQDGLLKAASAKNIPTKLLEQAGLVVGNAGSGLSDKFVNRLM